MNSVKRFVLTFIPLFMAVEITAQITIDGTITDSELNPISNALVEVVDEDDTANYYSVNTNELGYFTISGITDIGSVNNQLPSDYILLRNYPNPFNPSTIIYFELPKSENIEIKIYDILGREIRSLFNNFHKAGTYTINWDGRNNWNSPVAAGIYLCRLKTKDQFKVHKMVLLDGGSASIEFRNNTRFNKSFQDNLKPNINFNFSLIVSESTILTSNNNALSCSGDTTINLKVPKLVISEVIGTEGGEIESEEFSLLIPNGTFTNSENIKLFKSGEENIFSENRITNTCIIDGVPRGFSQNITLKLKYNHEPEGSAFMAVGIEEYIVEKEESRIIYDLVDADDSLGYVTAIIKPIMEGSQITTHSSLVKTTLAPYLIIFGTGLTKISTYVSNSTSIKYDAGLNDSKIALLGDYFDEAIKYFSDLSLTDETLFGDNEDRRIKVNIVDDKKTGPYYDYLMPSDFSGVETLNSFSMLAEFENVIKLYKINMNEVMFNSASDDDLSSFAADGIYRFVRLILLGSEFNWFDWSTITWIRREFSLNVLPWDSKFSKGPLIYQPFNGMEAGNYLYLDYKGKLLYYDNVLTIRTVGHGVGMSPFITFIMKEYNAEGKLLHNIFNEIINNKNYLPTDFILKSIDAPENTWWPHFFREYLQRYIYNISASDFLYGEVSIDEIVIESETDTLKEFDRTYYDLSAKLCKILITEEIKNTKKLHFKVGPQSLNLNYVTAMVFGLRDGLLIYLGDGTNFILGELEKYDALLACVVNSGNEPPYTGTSNIELSVGVAKESLFNYGILKVKSEGTYNYYDGSSNSGGFLYAEGKSRSGYFEENKFTSNWRGPYGSGTSEGRLEIKVDLISSPPKVTDFYLTETMQLSSTETITIEGANVNIPGIKISDNYYQFSLTGTDVCANINKITNSYDNNDGIYWWEFVYDKQCEADNYIQIYLGKE